jgi:hypothetical protein
MYVCFLLNNTWCEVVDDIPICMSTGSSNDISPLLCFHFWEPVYYKLDDIDFRLTHVRNADTSSISENLSDMPWPLRFWRTTLSRLSIDPMSDRLLIHMIRTFDLIHWSLAMLPRPSSSLVMTRQMMGRFYLRCLSLSNPSELISCTFLMDKQDGQWQF